MHGVDIASRATGLLLVAASVAKTIEPWRFLFTGWIPFAGDARFASWVSAGAVFVEGTLGALLIWNGARRLLARATLGLAMALAIVQISAVLRGSAVDCGCFGGLDVPRPVLWLVIAAVLAVAAAAARWGYTMRLNASALIAPSVGTCLAAMVVATLTGSDATKSEQDSIVAEVSRRQIGSVMVGSWGCDRCVERLRATGTPLLFLRPFDDGNRRSGFVPHAVVERGVSRRLWWSLIGPEPPAVYRVAGGELERVVVDKR